MGEPVTSAGAPPKGRPQAVNRDGSQVRGQFLLSLLGSVVWTFFAIIYLHLALSGGELLDVGLFVFYLVVAFLMLARRPARSEGAWWEVAISWGSAVLPMLGLRPAATGWTGPQALLQGIGQVAVLAALVSLGRSFSIAPADRGLVTRGAYRFVRHPMYAAELLSNAGFLIGNVSWRNIVALVALLASLVWRITREERTVGGYDAYAARVRWRLVPGIW